MRSQDLTSLPGNTPADGPPSVESYQHSGLTFLPSELAAAAYTKVLFDSEARVGRRVPLFQLF